MTRISDANLKVVGVDPNTVTLAWTGDADKLSSIWKNGASVITSLKHTQIKKGYNVQFTEGVTAAFEVLEEFPNRLAQSTEVRPELRPVLYWTPAPGEVPSVYRIYHREGLTGTESVVGSKEYRTGVSQFWWRTPTELNGLGGVWHWFRVEAVDLAGNETTRVLWSFYVQGLPAPVDTMALTGNSIAGFVLTIGRS